MKHNYAFTILDHQPQARQADMFSVWSATTIIKLNENNES